MQEIEAYFEEIDQLVIEMEATLWKHMRNFLKLCSNGQGHIISAVLQVVEKQEKHDREKTTQWQQNGTGATNIDETDGDKPSFTEWDPAQTTETRTDSGKHPQEMNGGDDDEGFATLDIRDMLDEEGIIENTSDLETPSRGSLTAEDSADTLVTRNRSRRPPTKGYKSQCLQSLCAGLDEHFEPLFEIDSTEVDGINEGIQLASDLATLLVVVYDDVQPLFPPGYDVLNFLVKQFQVRLERAMLQWYATCG
eukprot:scaffold1006_cov408-Prasinococcus_capsulatus_cf.AAC.16